MFGYPFRALGAERGDMRGIAVVGHDMASIGDEVLREGDPMWPSPTTPTTRREDAGAFELGDVIASLLPMASFGR